MPSLSPGSDRAGMSLCTNPRCLFTQQSATSLYTLNPSMVRPYLRFDMKIWEWGREAGVMPAIASGEDPGAIMTIV